MAKTQVFTEANLSLYDQLIKQYVDGADSKAIKSVAISGNALKFYKISEPVGETTPAYEITLPSTDISGLLAKLEGATAGDVVIANADGTVADGGVKLADLATKAEVEAVDGKADANATAIEAINNADTGILKTAQTYADTKVQELADGQVATNKSDIAKLNGDASTDGSVAKAVKDSADAIDAKIGTLADLDTTVKTDLVNAINEVRAAVDAGGTGSQVTIDTSATTEGYLKSYTIKQGENTVVVNDIPKDLVVVSGEVVVDPEGQTAGTYIKLVIANQEAPIYINVKSLVDVYTAEQSATQIQLSISDTNEISATIVAGSVGTTELTDGSVTTVKIADANVTLAKLAKDVTDAIADAKKAGTDASAAVTALEEGAVATNTANIATLQGLVGEGFEPISESFIRGLFA